MIKWNIDMYWILTGTSFVFNSISSKWEPLKERIVY